MTRQTVLAALLLLTFAGLLSAASELSATFLDVGQGDATLLVGPGKVAMLVDAGDDKPGVGRTVLEHLASHGIDRLHSVIITHAHADHFGGLFQILGKIPIGKVLYGTRIHTPVYEKLENRIHELGIPYRHLSTGDELELGTGVLSRVLYSGRDELPAGTPILTEEAEGQQPEGGVDLNGLSVVLKIGLGTKVILMGGDATASLEQSLLGAGAQLRSAVLKVSHHGSDGSSTLPFLEAVRPTYAAIMVGKGNSYGHPGQAALDRLDSVGAQVRRTDLQGTLEARTDGSSVSFGPCGLVEAGPAPRELDRLQLFELLSTPVR